MAEYYLISQLPSLDGFGESSPLPISEESFLQLCERLLPKRMFTQMEKLTLSPDRFCDASGSDFIDAWNESEQSLRLALCKVRSEKMKVPFDLQNRNIPAHFVKAATEAAEMENPMEAEKFLCRFRLASLESIRPMDSFSTQYLFYYGLKLKLIESIRKFDKQTGETVYRNIYNSILNGDGLEVKR